MKISVFEYKDYKKFIREAIEALPHAGRGMRKDLAYAIGCQTPYITHVLSGDYHFSIEQAEACSRWLSLKDEETEFFILLVLFARAGTKNLERVIGRQISERRTRHAHLKDRVGITTSLSIEDQLIYCSSWQFAAVHLALMNPSFQTLESLETGLKISGDRLTSILSFLVAKGLIKKERAQFKVVSPFLHFELGSPSLQQHHTNWRLKAIESIAQSAAGDLHYSAALSLSKEDFEWVRDRLSSLLETLATRIKESKDEQIAALTFDWFQLGGKI